MKEKLLSAIVTMLILSWLAGLSVGPNATCAAASFVQQGASAASGSTKSFSVTFGSKTAAGDLIVVGFDKSSTQTPTVTDSQGNTYTEIGSELISPGANYYRVYYAPNIKGGTNSVTVTLSASSSYLELYITEYSGISVSNPIDGQSGNSGKAGSVTSKTVTTSVAGDIIYGWCPADGTSSAGTGFTARSTFNDNLIEDSTSGSAGSYAATATASSGWTMQMVALLPASANTNPPTVPVNLTATAETTTTVSLAWYASTGSAGVAGYKIYRGGTQVGASTVTNFTDTGLTPSTAYSYTVSAHDAAGNNSAQSTALQVTTKAVLDTIPPVVAISSPLNNATVAASVGVSGTASDNVAVASVAVAIDGGALAAASGTTTWTYSWNTLPLLNGAHTIAAVATDTSGNTATNTISVIVNNKDTSPPSVPTSLTASGVTAFMISLSWNASTDNVGVAGYAIYRNGAEVATTTSPTFSDNGLTAATTYSYAVAAYDAAGNISAQSASLQVTTPGMPAAPPGSAQYPLQASSDGLSVVDQNGEPFFIVGDDAWSLANQVSDADVVTYLTDRASRGYNAIWMASADNIYSSNAPDNYYGNPPFDGPDFTSEDPAFWSHVDYVVEEAASQGISVWLSPAFVGLVSQDGYLASYGSSSDAVMTSYGAWLGNRYKNFPNIVWVLGGDADPAASGLYQKIADLANGIRSADTNHLITMEAARFTGGSRAPDGGYSSIQAWQVVGSVPSWLGLNWLYPTPANEAINVNINYTNATFMPPFIGEEWYEGEHSMTEPGLRSEAYTGILSGGYLGRFFGNDEIWTFGNTNFEETPGITWQSALGSEGSVEQAILGKLFVSREFWKMEPDILNTVMTAGYQEGITLAVDARANDGNTVIAYIPTQRAVTINLAQISGIQAVAWWFNPRTGTASQIGSYSTTGSQNFVPPDTNDWVLVIDSASANLGTPGTSVIDSMPPSVPTNLMVTLVSASSVSLSWSASTDNVGVAGYLIYRNGVKIGTNAAANFTDSGLSASTTYSYTVSAYDAAGNTSAQSAVVQATTQSAVDTTPPSVPSNLTLTGGTPTSVSFSWTASTDNVGVAGYQIFRNGVQITTTTNTYYQDNTLSANTPYTYGVAAFDAAGNVSQQSIWQFSIQWVSQ